MKSGQIYIGNIKMLKEVNVTMNHVACLPGIMGFAMFGADISTGITKENTTLIQVVEGRDYYVDVDEIKSSLDLFRIKKSFS